MRSIPNLSCCQLLLLFFAAFFSWVLFPRSFICYCWPVTFCEVCETRIFGKNITSEKCLTVSSFIIPNETEYDDAWKFFHVRNVQFMQNFQYITTVNQSQRPVERSGVHFMERVSVSKRFEFIGINSVRRPFKGNANSKNILREGTHLWVQNPKM